jgi:AraC-like DNA-binding protein
MAKTKPPEVRRLEGLFEEKFIPWAENGAPFMLLDNPPRSSIPVRFSQRSTAALPEVKRYSRGYPEIRLWKDRELNSLSVPLLGCIFEGEADYRVHTPPGVKGCESTVTILPGSFFAVAPNIPFSEGSRIAWERSGSPPENISGILWRLQRDGVGCLTFSCQNNRTWLHPYIFLYQTEATLLGEKLLAEMRMLPPLQAHPCAASDVTSLAPVSLAGVDIRMAALYWQLILLLMYRTIKQGECSVLYSAKGLLDPVGHQFPSQRLPGGQITRIASDYIHASLDDPALSSSTVAQLAGLSERHLNRLFEAETGLSVYQYIQQQRGEKACDLLSHQGIPIHYIANYCGFSQHSVFSTWFSNRYKCTPREYRIRSLRKMSAKPN